MKGHSIIGFNHGVLGLAENPALGPGFFRQNTSGQAQHPMIKTYTKTYAVLKQLLHMTVKIYMIVFILATQKKKAQGIPAVFHLLERLCFKAAYQRTLGMQQIYTSRGLNISHLYDENNSLWYTATPYVIQD